LIEIDFLKELDRFNLALKKNSVEINQGEQKSHDQGQGMVFEDHNKYNPGDDIRRIDWKAYARTGELYIKRFEEERSITVHVLVDRSSSMDFGTTENKYDYAGKLGLSIAYMVSNTNDRFRFSVFSETITDISSARRNADLAGLVDTLNGLRKTPESLVGRCMTEYGKRIQNKSVVVVISDFLVDIEQVEEGMTALKDTDTILVNTLDASEWDPEQMEGEKILKDPESGSKLRTYLSRKMKSSYRQEIEQHCSKVEEVAESYGAGYVRVSTGDDFFDSFLKLWNELEG